MLGLLLLLRASTAAACDLTLLAQPGGLNLWEALSTVSSRAVVCLADPDGRGSFVFKDIADCSWSFANLIIQ